MLNNMLFKKEKSENIIPLSLLLLIIVIKSTIITVLLFYQNTNQFQEWKRNTYFEESYYWLPLSAEAELGRFGVALLGLNAGRDTQDIDVPSEEVEFRLQILWSRINLLKSGRFYSWALENRSAMELIEELVLIVNTIEDHIYGGEFSTSTASVLLDDAVLAAKSLTSVALEADRLNKEELFDEIDTLQLLTKIGTATSILAAILLGAFSISYIRQVRKEEIHIAAVNRELANLVDEREYFIKVASHELRNAAQVAMALIERDWSRDQILKYETKMAMGAFKQNVDSLLDFARSLADRLDISFSKFVVGDVVRMWCEGAEVEQSKIIIVNDYTFGTEVLGQRAIFFRCFQNILVNAVRHANSKIIVDVEIIIQHSCIRVQIHDDGLGIPNEIIEFVRSHSRSPINGFGSLGIGLAIVIRLLDSVGGKLYFPRDKSGGVILIEFPVTILKKAKDIIIDDSAFVLSGGNYEELDRGSQDNIRILYCEDEKDIREAFGEMMRSRWSSVDVFGSFEDFMLGSETFSYDIAVLDYNLSDGTAKDVFNVLLAANPKCRTILLSGLDVDDPESLENFDLILKKPVAFSELIREMDRIV